MTVVLGGVRTKLTLFSYAFWSTEMFSVDVQPSLDSRCIGLSSHLFQNNQLTNICRPQAGILLLDHCQPQTSCASALERDTKNDYHHLFPIRTEMKCTDFVEGEQMLKC